MFFLIISKSKELITFSINIYLKLYKGLISAQMLSNLVSKQGNIGYAHL